MSLASDTHIVLDEHDKRLDQHDTRLDSQGATLDRHEHEHSEFRGFLAVLDRREDRIVASIDELKTVVQAQFRDIREELRRRRLNADGNGR